MIRYIFNWLTLVLAVMICAGCGDGDGSQSPFNRQTRDEQTDTVGLPAVDESSISYDAERLFITFTGTLPVASYKFKALISPQKNFMKVTKYEVFFYDDIQKYAANAGDLQPGTAYYISIAAFDADDKQLMSTSRHEITIPKRIGPDAPDINRITVIPPTGKNVSDGQLKGDVLTSDIEYSTDNGTTWTGVKASGIISGLPSGDVMIRYHETDTTQAGKSASVTVPEYESNTDINGENGKSEGLRVKRK